MSGYNSAIKPRDKKDFKDLIDYTLQPGETVDNYTKIIEEYQKAHDSRKIHVDKLKSEIEKIRNIEVDDWL